MSVLNKLDFVKKLPTVKTGGRSGKTPLERAKERSKHEIDLQIALARNPTFVEKVMGKRGAKKGEVVKSRKPRSWVTVDGNEAFVTPRFSNKPLNLGGRKGSHIRAAGRAGAIQALEVIAKWADSSEADAVLAKAMEDAKRGRRRK